MRGFFPCRVVYLLSLLRKQCTGHEGAIWVKIVLRWVATAILRSACVPLFLLSVSFFSLVVVEFALLSISA